MARYIIGFLLAVGLIVVVIVLIVRSLSGGPTGPKPLDLNSYSTTDVTVQFTVDSPVAASQTHHDIIINVGNIQSTLTVTEGYEGKIVRRAVYPMNVSAYAAFLHSLTVNGFMHGKTDPAQADERGHCALQDRFIYEVLDNEGNQLQHYWYTSCRTGTMLGNTVNIQKLFQLQIPNYDKLTSDIQL